MVSRPRLPDVAELRALLAAALMAVPCGLSPAHAAADAPRINCAAPHRQALDLAPTGPGPLALAQIYCHVIRFSPFPRSAPVISPDGRSIAYYEHDTILRTSRLDVANNWIDYHAELGSFARFGSEPRSPPAFAWSTHGRFLWTATQSKVRPSGFAISGMRPARTGDDGRLQRLPPLRHEAGPLDGLLWAGGDGLGVAQFGTRGGFYRPEHDDPSPTFAMVDAARGRVLDSLPFAAVETLRGRTPPYAFVRNAAATILQDGRVRVLLSVGQWVVWTQGETPRAVADPYAGERHSRMALSPDGARVLVARLLRTEGGICDRVRGGCTPGRPVEGVLAALHDLRTGQAVWSIRATAVADHEFPTPAISEDGRYALVGLMPQDSSSRIALIFLEDGKVVQTIPAPGGDYAMGFARRGHTVWTYAHGVTALYNVRHGAQ